MDPFTGTLTRLGFLLYSIVLVICLLGFGKLNNLAEVHYVSRWTIERVILGIILVIFIALIFIRRIQNAGLNNWLVILSVVPIISTILWVLLLLKPTKVKYTQSTINK
jgi:uncharacterized membrane protein YhaH (DUF805 family)